MVNKIEEEDDFKFGDLSTGKGSETEKNEEEEDKKEEGREEEEEEEEESEEGKTDDDDEREAGSKDDDDEEEDKEKKKEEGKKEEKKDGKKDTSKSDEKKKKQKAEDIFLDDNEEGSTEAEKKISLKRLAKDFDIEMEKDDDEAEFKTKFSEKLEKSKLELKLDGYSDAAKSVIRHLNENGGDINSFFMNKQIVSMQNVLALDPETKVRNVRIQEIVAEGKSRKEAAEAVEAELGEMSVREIKNIAEAIDDQARSILNNEVKKIVGDQEIKATQARQRQEAEAAASRSNLKTFIEKQDNFLGLKLTPEAKKLVMRDIENGNFDKALSAKPEEVKFASYMFSKYGDKIRKKISDSLSEENRKGYNASNRKHLDALHKTDDSLGRKTGHTPDSRSNDGSSKPKWGSSDFE